MRSADLAQVVAISAAVHGDYAEPLAVYAERLALYPHGCWVSELAGVISGFLVTHPWRTGTTPALGTLLGSIPADADTYYLHDIALLPRTRGLGLGHSALLLVEAQARAAGCAEISLVAVNGADRYWEQRGFVKVGEGDYGPGTWLMRKPV
jgi:GNAT superfamily N-acetyltransferase